MKGADWVGNDLYPITAHNRASALDAPGLAVQRLAQWSGGKREFAVLEASDQQLPGHPEYPGLQDFGELLLRSDKGHGYVRVDWFTPDGLPTWGDGRLTILGTEGYIELRKYIDVSGRPGTNHLFVVNGRRNDYIACEGLPLTYFRDFSNDVLNRTETAMPQAHAFKVMERA